MILKKLALLFIFILLIASVSFAEQQKVREQKSQESDQQINDFSLSGFGEKGKKTWDLAGKSADIFGDVIKLKDIVGNLYGKDEDIKLTADKGDFDKAEGKVHLEQNVVITTSSGARLTTDTLDWDRKNQVVKTEDVVNIERDNMVTVAQGATGHPNLNKVTLEKDVTVNIKPDKDQAQKEGADKTKIVITCDGPLAIDYEKNIATFNNNVKVDRQDMQIYSDMMDVYFVAPKDNSGSESKETLTLMGTKIEKIIAHGNVKIVRGENISYSEEATYTALDKKITLLGRPKLIIYSTEELNASSGN